MIINDNMKAASESVLAIIFGPKVSGNHLSNITCLTQVVFNIGE